MSLVSEYECLATEPNLLSLEASAIDELDENFLHIVPSNIFIYLSLMAITLTYKTVYVRSGARHPSLSVHQYLETVRNAHQTDVHFRLLHTSS